jgi:hypothetical protein
MIPEARRRKWLEDYPEATNTDEAVVFDTSIIPWWAWMKRFHLPEAEKLNGNILNSHHGAIYITKTNVLFFFTNVQTAGSNSLCPWIPHTDPTFSSNDMAYIYAGRAAMVGFFMAYFVDSLTGVGLVDQMGNFFCKTLLFVAVAGVLLIRKNEDLDSLKKIIDETTFYDKQWQATWQDETTGGPKN